MDWRTNGSHAPFIRYNNVGQFVFRLRTSRSGSRPKRMRASWMMVRNSNRKSFRCRAISQIWSAKQLKSKAKSKKLIRIRLCNRPGYLCSPSWRHSNKTRELRNSCSLCTALGTSQRRVGIGLSHRAIVLRTTNRSKSIFASFFWIKFNEFGTLMSMMEEFLVSGDAKPIFTDTPPVLLISYLK